MWLFRWGSAVCWDGEEREVGVIDPWWGRGVGLGQGDEEVWGEALGGMSKSSWKARSDGAGELMNAANESDLARTLRWMKNNVRGAYEAVHPPGTVDAGKHRVNSGTCLLVCCYINALGKVLWKGAAPPDRKDFRRFERFVSECMADYVAECDKKKFPPTPKSRQGGVEWLYEVFRCGFVHGFYAGESGGWARRPELDAYWVETDPLVVINIDRLVSGFEEALERFRESAAKDQELDARFSEYILAD